MQGYDKDDLFAEEIEICAIEGKFWEETILKKAQTTFYDSKRNLRRGVISFFSKKVKTDINKYQ